VKKLLTMQEAAERIGMSDSWISELIQKGMLPFSYIPIGQRIKKFDPDEIDAWLERIKVPAAGRQKKSVASHTATPQEAPPVPAPPPVTPVIVKSAPVKSPERQVVVSADGGKPARQTTTVKKIRRIYK
jgi:excisionase family DNA binding protein